jgi:hypothetical protein
VDTVGVDDGKGFRAALGIRAPIRWVVAKLENVTGVPEQRPLKILSIPSLFLLAYQSQVE